MLEVRQIDSIGHLIQALFSVFAVWSLGNIVFRSFHGDTWVKRLDGYINSRFYVLMHEIRTGKEFNPTYERAENKALMAEPRKLTEEEMKERRARHKREVRRTLPHRFLNHLLTCIFCHSFWASVILCALLCPAHGAEWWFAVLAYTGAGTILPSMSILAPPLAEKKR